VAYILSKWAEGGGVDVCFSQTKTTFNLQHFSSEVFLLLFVRLYTWISVSARNLVVFCRTSTGGVLMILIVDIFFSEHRCRLYVRKNDGRNDSSRKWTRGIGKLSKIYF